MLEVWDIKSVGTKLVVVVVVFGAVAPGAPIIYFYFIVI
jgi:hypothetical protein